MAFRRRRDPLHGVTGELQRVLDAAAAPGLDAELVGQHAASAAFLSSSTTPERAVSWSLAKLIATPVAAVVAITGMTGGVALAAATGNLPAGAQSLASKIGAPAPAGEREAGQRGAGERGAGERSATATANLNKTNRGRCTAVTMGNKAAHGKALQAPPLVGKTSCPATPTKAKPGSQRSATATANLLDKPAKPVKPAKPAKPARPAAPAAATDNAARPDSASRPEGATRPDSATRPEVATRPEGRSADAPGRD